MCTPTKLPRCISETHFEWYINESHGLRKASYPTPPSPAHIILPNPSDPPAQNGPTPSGSGLGLLSLVHGQAISLNSSFTGVQWPIEDDTKPADWKHPDIKSHCETKGYEHWDYTPGTLADFHIYSDDKCQNHIRNIYFTLSEEEKFCKGTFVCFPGPAHLDLPNPFYIIAGGGFSWQSELYVADGHACSTELQAPASPVIKGDNHCIGVYPKERAYVGSHISFKFAPQGFGTSLYEAVEVSPGKEPGEGDGDDDEGGKKKRHDEQDIATSSSEAGSELPQDLRRSRSRERRQMPAGLKCTRFDPDPESEWNRDTWTRAYKISDPVTCPAGQDDSCDITYSKGTEVSFTLGVSTSISATAVWASLETQISSEWGETTTTDFGYGYKVQPGRTAFLAARRPAIEIRGWYRGCSNGWDYRGEVIVPKAGTHDTYTYLVDA